MYPAIEAIAKGGIIEPLEPVEFEDNEQLVILRLTKPWTEKGTTAPPQDWHDFVGILKSSPHFNDAPVAIQQCLRVR
jgi:hypothetical protein